MAWDKHIRGEGVMLSAESHRYLRIIAKALKAGSGALITKDEIADTMILKQVALEYPWLKKRHLEIDSIEEQMLLEFHTVRPGPEV